ncbi:MAG TPA: hypothetical protein VF103_10985 [Polyangiaceae bacterium]
MRRHRSPMRPKTLASALALFATFFSSIALAQAPDAGNSPGEWPYVFPLLGDKVAHRGIKLPLPFGLGLNYVFIDQPIEISRVAVGVNDSEMVDISHLIKFGDIDSSVHALNLRADLWVLPFLNVYGMGNYAIQSKTAVSIVEPFAFDAGAVQQGVGGGFGGTFAGGAWGFFGTLDLNWTWNKMEKLDQPVRTFLLTPRIGKNLGKLWGVEFIVWVGAMRQKIESETKGQIRLSDAISGDGEGKFHDDLQEWFDGLPPGQQAAVRGIVGRIQAATGGDPVIKYDLDKAVAYPWNLLVGGELGLSPAWRVRTEVGFIHRTQFLVGLNYRFGGFLRPAGDSGP